MADLGYLMVDADNHLYEGRDAFTRHLDPKYAGEFFWVNDERGRTHVILHGQFWPYIPNPTFDPIAVPGSMELMYGGGKTRAQLEAEGIRILEPLSNRPEYMSHDERVARMDEQGVQATWMFPTMVSGMEHACRDDIDLTYALIDALNEYIYEDWGYGADGRIYAMPVVSLSDPDRAVKQLELGLERGCRAVMMRPSPVITRDGYKSPGLPMFDRFWALAAEAKVAVTCHAGESGYYEYAGRWTGSYKLEPFSKTQSFNEMFVEGRAVSDFITAMSIHGAFTRNPGLNVVAIENGCAWVNEVVRKFKKFYVHYRESFDADPLELFHEHVYVSPFWEDDIKGLAGLMPVEHILAGSDWPHAEGLSDPTDFIKGLQDFDEASQRKIMRENTLALIEGRV
jgi:predicted TIM-barrel fold metal-dependent hydrolase